MDNDGWVVHTLGEIVPPVRELYGAVPVGPTVGAVKDPVPTVVSKQVVFGKGPAELDT